MFRPTSASNEAEIEVTGTTGVHSYPVTAWRGGLVGLMFVLAFTLLLGGVLAIASRNPHRQDSTFAANQLCALLPLAGCDCLNTVRLCCCN